MIENAALENILRYATDLAVVCEIYSADAQPASDGFDPADALDCFARVSGVAFAGQTYKKLIQSIGTIERTITEKTNSAQITFDNLSREISDFEFTHGFEGLILVIRLISRARSDTLAESMILFVGRCEQPKSGTKEKLTVTANFILSSLDTEIPRRKFSPVDHEGRVPGTPLFEGFRFTPQYGSTTYSVRERRGGLLGFLGFKKTVTKTLQYSSHSDLDAEKSVPEAFGRVQLAGTHMAYADAGTFFKITTGFAEGEIEAYSNIRSASPPYTLGGQVVRYGKPGGVDEQIPHPFDTSFPGRDYYSRTAHAYVVVGGTEAGTVDPAPVIVAVILAKKLYVPDESGVWNTFRWSDNPAAVARFVLTSADYYKLGANWIDDASFTEAFNFNDEFLFDFSYSDFLFLPDTVALAKLTEGESSHFLPTSSVRREYFEYLKGSLTAAETFLLPAFAETYDPESLIPIEPPEPGEPGPGGGSTLDLLFFIRRRYTCNAVVTEQMKAIDFLHKVLFASSRMFLTQGANGKIKLNHKKPVPWALGTAALSGSSLALDDVSQFVGAAGKLLLIDPHTTAAEVRSISAAQFSLDQNSVSLSASANITVTGFAGCDGAEVPATAMLVVDSTEPGVQSSFTLDGTEVAFIATTDDTRDTAAAFIAAAINAHPVLQRKFSSAADDDAVNITARFGTVGLSSALEFSHTAPVANPSAAPDVSAASGGSLPAGDYRVAYAFENSRGRTLLSAYETLTLSANQKISVSSVSLPAGATSIAWFVVPADGSSKLRYHSSNTGAAFEINSLPLLTNALPPDINRTGAEVMQIAAVFSDRGAVRANLSRSNVIKASFEWLLGNREKPVNRIDLKYRDSTDDFRLIELRLRDDAHIAKTKKVSNIEINGQAIDNYNQAYRIASGLLAEARDADFFERWSATREALLLEEGDVVAVTDAGAGFVNLPVRVEEIRFDLSKSLPKVSFTARKYSTTLYDDSVAERQIPVVIETGSESHRAARQVTYEPTNFTETRTLDASTATLSDVADVLATVMDDLENNRE